METISLTQKSKDKLNELSDTFKPTDVKFLLALNVDFSVDDCIDNAEGMISRLHKFVEAGHSDAELDFKYGEVLVY